MTTIGTVIAMLGVIVSAMLPLAVVFIPIYLLFIKPRFFNSTTTRKSVQSSKLMSTPGKKNLLLEPCTSVPPEDMAYLAKVLSPDSTSIDILVAVITTPENIEWSIQDLDRSNAIRADRIEKDKLLAKSSKNNNKKTKIASSFDDIVNADGWADDDDENDNSNENKAEEIRARQAEEERKADMERLRIATGQAVQLLEGIDDGVIGQLWVEKSLSSHGVWPPTTNDFLKSIQSTNYDYNGKKVSALNHPGIRRMLCMTIGRLNSIYLNGHSELLEAGSKKLIDQTYFRSSMEFRNRIAVVLEGVLRIGMLVRSSRLVSTTIETICIFKIGTMLNPKSISWFNNLMMKQYNILPRIELSNGSIQTPVGDDNPNVKKDNDNNDEFEQYVVCNDISDVRFDIHRIHADNFLRQKVEMFDKQGIPAEVGLSTYREAWWFLVQMKRLDGPTPPGNYDDDDNDNDNTTTGSGGIFSKNNPLLVESKIPITELQKFELENIENRLITAWPLIIQNVAQKMGKMKIVFKAPSVPGKYRYTITLKSAEFLNADTQFTIDIQVVDSKTANRKPRIIIPLDKKKNNTTTPKTITEEESSNDDDAN
jgi:hypothetical protein